MGSYVDETGDHDLTHYPVPVLTLNVELDGGLARPGKTAIWWHQFESLVSSKGEEKVVTQKPVIILPGLNHSDFCPGFDVPGDLPAEVDQKQATQEIGIVTAAFLHLQVPSLPETLYAASRKVLKDRVEWTRGLMTPYLQAQEWETKTGDVRVSQEGSSPFCAKMQHLTAGLAPHDDHQLEVVDGFHASSSNLEHCHPNWTHTGTGIQVDSCSHTDFYTDIANTGSISAASEIACKMLSSDRITQQLKVKAADPSVPCSAGNRDAVHVAETLAAPSTLARYKKIGKGWCFLEDQPTFQNIGPLWVFHDALQLTENATCMAVASPVLKTEIDGKIYPGNFYCKFLSPARVLDWMMTDSLKKSSKTQSAKSSSAVWV